MIEHLPWRGRCYAEGIEGQRVAIVGYSHHRKETDCDNADFTTSVVKRVIGGEQKGDAFFTAVRNAFGYDKAADFWQRVLFFNFLPDCVGTDAEKYGAGSAEQIERAKERFTRIIGQEKPEKVFVFTRKGWRNCPLTLREEQGLHCEKLAGIPDYSWGQYRAGGHTIMACGMRHPQRATSEELRSGVQEFLAMRA